MPTFQGLVSEEQVNALVAYIKSISETKAGDGAKANAVAPQPAAKAQPNGNQVQ
jgi:mono/diheme cytochrome c family protein